MAPGGSLPGRARSRSMLILQSYRVLRQNATLSFVGIPNNDTYHLRRFFDDACFFLFSPANLCRGFSSTASSSSS